MSPACTFLCFEGQRRIELGQHDHSRVVCSADPAHPHAKSGKWSFVTGYLSSVKSVDVLDPQTVQLHLKYPTGWSACR